MSVKNSTILEKCWIESGNDFQQRIPNPSIQGYAAAIDALFEPYNNDLFNQFSNLLVGLMGTYVESKLFENPLRELKKPAKSWGSSERMVACKYLQAHSTRNDDETLLKLEKPEYVEWFYSVSPGRRYEFSWNRFEMQRNFSEPDSYAFDDLLAATITQMQSSDNYDEMNAMIQMFAEADHRFGCYRHQISAPPTDKETGQELLAKIKADAGKMKFPTIVYNHIDIPVFESTDTLVLWVTPEVDANLDVYALAELFNVDRAEVRFRKIVIPEFPIPNVYAALTSEDFIYARDVWYGIEPPFYNPGNRSYKYYLYHDQIIGVNPVANCVLYTTDEDTAIPTVTIEVTGMELIIDQAGVTAGGQVQLKPCLLGTVTPTNDQIALQPNAATYVLTAKRNNDPVALNSRTYVDDYGILHIQKSGLELNDVITIEATSVYINPSGATQEFSATGTVEIVAPTGTSGKDGCPVTREPYIEYTNVTEVASASE